MPDTLKALGELAADWEALNGFPAVGLSLNNSGDTVTLFQVAAAGTTVVDSLAYAGSDADPDEAQQPSAWLGLRFEDKDQVFPSVSPMHEDGSTGTPPGFI